MSQQDWALMQRVAAGDEDAVAELYDRFGALVHKAARQVLAGRTETDDAVQEIFVRLWRTADRYDPRRAKLVTWVMLIARRHLIDRLRRSAARPNPSSLDGEWTPSVANDDRGPQVTPIEGGAQQAPEGENRGSAGTPADRHRKGLPAGPYPARSQSAARRPAWNGQERTESGPVEATRESEGRSGIPVSR